ncbi:hypothetical protein OUZ56_017417 [Daphnia magna]|uniref:HAT C-terminal dimerisation domain-containing protein n=1 Tax=Daphnia magna TaxID=35525 RepID=A0ABR0ASR7_9CRUS|nr:hypothetical protein OUZ56_017417 [Daphnia magna]
MVEPSLTLIRHSFIDTEEVFKSVGFRLVAKNVTRWNSEMYSLTSIIKAFDTDPQLQNRLNATTTKYPKLSPLEIKQLKETVMVLTPFQEATDDFQCDYETIGTVVPAYINLLNQITLTVQSNRGSAELNPARSLTQGAEKSASSEAPYSAKRARGLWGLYSTLSWPTRPHSAGRSRVLDEFDQYLNEPNASLEIQENPSDANSKIMPLRPLKYWDENKHRFPLLAPIARDILGIPTTSVNIEQCFGTALDIFAIKRINMKVFEENMYLKGRVILSLDAGLVVHYAKNCSLTNGPCVTKRDQARAMRGKIGVLGGSLAPKS